MKNNRGFTLIELIVVMAILSILAGAAVYSINSVSSARAKKFSSDLSGLLSRCRVDTLSGAPAPTYLKLSLESGTYYAVLYEGGSEQDRQKLGSGSLTCTFAVDGAAAAYTMGAAQPQLCLAFSRTTGAFLALEKVKDAGGNALNGALSGSCTAITVSSGGGSYTLTLVPETGYHTVSR